MMDFASARPVRNSRHEAAVATRQAAHDALARGWSVIPVFDHTKRPAIEWRAFQTRRPTLSHLDAWMHRWARLNLAAVTGAISGLVVLDVDPAHGGDVSLAAVEQEIGKLPPTVEARSGGGGRHLYFSHPRGHVASRVGLRPGLDLRGDGGCIVMPPSIHPSGNAYAWVPGRSPDEMALAPFPLALLRLR